MITLKHTPKCGSYLKVCQNTAITACAITESLQQNGLKAIRCDQAQWQALQQTISIVCRDSCSHGAKNRNPRQQHVVARDSPGNRSQKQGSQKIWDSKLKVPMLQSHQTVLSDFGFLQPLRISLTILCQYWLLEVAGPIWGNTNSSIGDSSLENCWASLYLSIMSFNGFSCSSGLWRIEGQGAAPDSAAIL